jgi:signal transduction histidine kinase
MVAVTTPLDPITSPLVTDNVAKPRRPIGLVPSASMVTGAAIAVIWFWIPLVVLLAAITSIPSVIGFLLAGVVFVYLVRGADSVERVRSEAVFELGIPVPTRKLSHRSGFQGWCHQLWLDVSSAWFWKAFAHHYLRMIYDLLATGVAFVLVASAFAGPAVAMAIHNSDAAAGLRFLPLPLVWLLAAVALAAAAAIVVFAPAVDATIDRWLLPPSPTAALRYEVDALTDARAGAVSSAQTERHRIERDLHDSVQPRLVSLAMTIGLAQTKLDTDLAQARQLIGEAHDEAKNALVELRNVVRGIAPTILADRGLDAALSSVVQRMATSGVPTSLNVYLPRRLPEEVESVAYFVVAEALTNVARHSQASNVLVTARRNLSMLTIEVQDDGQGNAQVAPGGGLAGLTDRVEALDGRLTVASPEGGPTILHVEIPCG